jgi:hypothetical protein
MHAWEQRREKADEERLHLLHKPPRPGRPGRSSPGARVCGRVIRLRRIFAPPRCGALRWRLVRLVGMEALVLLAGALHGQSVTEASARTPDTCERRELSLT